jgi:hypothetical protein
MVTFRASLRVQSWQKFQNSPSLLFSFVATYQGLLQATSILTLWQNQSPQAPCVVLGLKPVIWSLWVLCSSTAKVWCAERCSSVFQCSNVSTTPLRQWGFRQCLPFSWTTPRGKHCWHPIAIRGHSTTTWTEFCHFLTPPLRGQFLYPERGQKQTFFDPLPPLILST